MTNTNTKHINYMRLIHFTFLSLVSHEADRSESQSDVSERSKDEVSDS